MGDKRLLYRTWISDLGRDPRERNVLQLFDQTLWRMALAGGFPDDQMAAALSREDASRRSRGEIVRARVSSALATLSERERLCIERYYFEGMSYRRIAQLSGRSIEKTRAVHERAFRKLRKELAATATELFGIEARRFESCPLCQSPDRIAIDDLLRSRDRSQSWSPVIRILRERFGIRVTTPQRLIGHERYH